MNGLITRYKESLAKTQKPIPYSKIKRRMDYRGLLAYVKSQGKKILAAQLQAEIENKRRNDY